MNNTTRRFPRSTREAFAHERAGCITHHRAPLFARIFQPFTGLVTLVAILAFLAVVYVR